MKEIFISYSTVDTVQAETVRNVLEKNGLSCWMAPRDIPGGSNYTKEIPIAIRNCKVFVLILSSNAQSSHWVLKELDSAVNCGKVILPFMLEDCVLNDEFNFLLTGAQRYAAYQKTAEAMETLIGRIKGILNVPNAAPVETATPEPKPLKPEVTAVPLNLGNTVCVSCGGSDLKALPGRVLRHGPYELLTMLLIPALAIAFGTVTFWICALALPYHFIMNLPLFLLIGGLAGGFCGDLISKNMVRRKRLRSRIHATCYRCNRCRKVFLHNAPLEN